MARTVVAALSSRAVGEWSRRPPHPVFVTSRRGEKAHGKADASDPHARPARERPVAELRHRPQASGQGQGLRRRPAGPARAVLQDPQGLLEGRHGRRVRLWRRRHPPVHRGQGRRQQAAVPGRRRVPHAARDAARRHALQHRRAAQDGRHLGKARLRPHRVPRPVGRHHVPGRDQRERAAGVRRDQRTGVRPGRRRPGRAHVDVLRRRRALRAVVLRRSHRAPHDHQQLPRRHPPAVAARTSSSSSSRDAPTTA